MAAHARQAKDQDLILWATEIKVRAERKCGAMLAESAAHGERNTGGKPSKAATVSENVTNGLDVKFSRGPIPTLAEIGITRDQSSRYQQLASMSDEHFEAGFQQMAGAGRCPCQRRRGAPPGWAYICPTSYSKKEACYRKGSRLSLFDWCRRDDSNTRPSHYE